MEEKILNDVMNDAVRRMKAEGLDVCWLEMSRQVPSRRNTDRTREVCFTVRYRT